MAANQRSREKSAFHQTQVNFSFKEGEIHARGRREDLSACDALVPQVAVLLDSVKLPEAWSLKGFAWHANFPDIRNRSHFPVDLHKPLTLPQSHTAPFASSKWIF